MRKILISVLQPSYPLLRVARHFGTIRHRRRSNRSPAGISLISYDNNNGDERSERRKEREGRGGIGRTRRTTTITGIKPRVGLVRNSHIDRALRMEAGERFESSWSSKPVSSSGTLPRLPSSLVIPAPRSPGVLLVLSHPFRFLAPYVGPRRHRRGKVQVVLRQDYPVNNAPNSPRDLSCIIAKLFRSRFQSACLLFSSFGSPSLSRSLSYPLSSTRKRFLCALLEVRGITLPSRRQDDDVLLQVLLFLSLYLDQRK